MSRIYSPIRGASISGVRSPIRQLIENTSEPAGGVPVTEGLLAWFDSDDAATIDVTSDGDPVGEWKDKSGNALDATQTGLPRPIYKTNILNGRPIIRFDSVDDFLDLGNVSQLEVDSFTIHAVCLHRTTLTAKTIFGWQFNNGADKAGAIIQFDLANKVKISAINQSNNFVTQATPTAFGIDTFYIITYKKDSAVVDIRVDGVVEVSAGLLATPVDYATTLTKTTHIGAANTDAGPVSFFFDGDIAELIFYDRALTSGEIDQIEKDYLSAKWGISI